MIASAQPQQIQTGSTQEKSTISRTACVLFLFTALVLTAFSTPAMAKGVPDSFADPTEKLAPTVVNIYTTQLVKASGPRAVSG